MLIRLSKRKNGQLDFHHNSTAIGSGDQHVFIHRHLQEDSWPSSLYKANARSRKRIAQSPLESGSRNVAFCGGIGFSMVGYSLTRNIPTVYGKWRRHTENSSPFYDDVSKHRRNLKSNNLRHYSQEETGGLVHHSHSLKGCCTILPIMLYYKNRLYVNNYKKNDHIENTTNKFTV